MFVSTCRLELYLPGCGSLKEKRALLRSLLDRLRRRQNISAAEVDYQDLWQRSVLGLCSVNSDHGGAERAMQMAIEFVEKETEMEVIGCEVDVY